VINAPLWDLIGLGKEAEGRLTAGEALRERLLAQADQVPEWGVDHSVVPFPAVDAFFAPKRSVEAVARPMETSPPLRVWLRTAERKT